MRRIFAGAFLVMGEQGAPGQRGLAAVFVEREEWTMLKSGQRRNFCLNSRKHRYGMESLEQRLLLATYSVQDGSSTSVNLTVTPGTHTFIVNGVIASRWTAWNVNNAEREVDTSTLLNAYSDPSFNWTFSSGTTKITASMFAP